MDAEYRYCCKRCLLGKRIADEELQSEVFSWSLSIRTRSEPRCKASDSARMDVASRVRRLAENTALLSWMQDLAQSIIVYRQELNLCREDNQVVTK